LTRVDLAPNFICWQEDRSLLLFTLFLLL